MNTSHCKLWQWSLASAMSSTGLWLTDDSEDDDSWRMLICGGTIKHTNRQGDLPKADSLLNHIACTGDFHACFQYCYQHYNSASITYAHTRQCPSMFAVLISFYTEAQQAGHQHRHQYRQFAQLSEYKHVHLAFSLYKTVAKLLEYTIHNTPIVLCCALHFHRQQECTYLWDSLLPCWWVLRPLPVPNLMTAYYTDRGSVVTCLRRLKFPSTCDSVANYKPVIQQSIYSTPLITISVQYTL